LQALAKGAWCTLAYCKQPTTSQEPTVSEATIKILKTGYSPSSINVKAGSAVTLHLENSDTYGCQLAFTIPKLNIRKIVPPGNSETLTFTAPEKPSQLAFMCSMGMYRGVINVN
jgi:plastocyanin domain-containing protein